MNAKEVWYNVQQECEGVDENFPTIKRAERFIDKLLKEGRRDGAVGEIVLCEVVDNDGIVEDEIIEVYEYDEVLA